MNWKLAVGGTLAALSLLFAGLFIKNKQAEKTYKSLGKNNVVIMSKKIRKEKYIVYKQIAVFAANIMQQMRNNINTALIEQYINGPESPLKVKDLFDQIIEKICRENDLTVQEYATSVQKYKNDPEVQEIERLHDMDYKDSLKGKLPHFNIVVPSTLTKEVFIQIQNKITKLAYCQQVKIFRKLKEYSEMELQQNPSLLQDLGNPEEEQQNILREYELETEFEPASAVFKQAEKKHHSDLVFKAKIQEIQTTYQRLLRKYAPKLQAKTITDHQLNELEEQILRVNIKP